METKDKKKQEIPYTAWQIGKLARMVAQENARQKRWIYTMEYYCGKWVWVRRRGYTSGESVDVVPRDTRATEAGLEMALAAMQKAAAETA